MRMAFDGGGSGGEEEDWIFKSSGGERCEESVVRLFFIVTAQIYRVKPDSSYALDFDCRVGDWREI